MVALVGKLTEPDLADRGILNYKSLQTLAVANPSDRIERLMADRSINLLVGDSGLGKTAFSMMQGVCVASGTPFLGLSVKAGTVLYCDAESGIAECERTLRVVSRFLGLVEPPDDFYIWSPNFDPRTFSADSTPADLLCEQVKTLKPVLTMVDPLRAFWPDAEDKSKDAMKMIRQLRALSKEVGCAWTLNHHRRKRDHQNLVNLERDRHTWFEEAAGSLALVNGADTRLGVEASRHANADLLLAGFMRSIGWLGSFYLERVHDEEGEPQGYRMLSGADYLNDHYRQAFGALRPSFRFKDAHAALGGSSASSTAAFLKQCLVLKLVRKHDAEYVKVVPGGASGGNR